MPHAKYQFFVFLEHGYFFITAHKTYQFFLEICLHIKDTNMHNVSKTYLLKFEVFFYVIAYVLCISSCARWD